MEYVVGVLLGEGAERRVSGWLGGRRECGGRESAYEDFIYHFIQFIRSTCSLIMELLYCELRIVPRTRSIPAAAVRALSGKGREGGKAKKIVSVRLANQKQEKKRDTKERKPEREGERKKPGRKGKKGTEHTSRPTPRIPYPYP